MKLRTLFRHILLWGDNALSLSHKFASVLSPCHMAMGETEWRQFQYTCSHGLLLFSLRNASISGMHRIIKWLKTCCKRLQWEEILIISTHIIKSWFSVAIIGKPLKFPHEKSYVAILGMYGHLSGCKESQKIKMRYLNFEGEKW